MGKTNGIESQRGFNLSGYTSSGWEASPNLEAEPEVESSSIGLEKPPILPTIIFQNPSTLEYFDPGRLHRALLKNNKPFDIKNIKIPKSGLRATFQFPDEAPTPSRRTNTITSTFYNDPKHFITIIITTPEDELLDHVSQSHRRNPRSSPVMSLPSPPRLNPSFLMPPPAIQLRSRHIQRARELREMQKWLIAFMNEKGDQVPPKLRSRMMAIYSIRECDLSPKVQLKVNGKEHDEDVVLDPMKEKQDHISKGESLRMLGRAFQSQVPLTNSSSVRQRASHHIEPGCQSPAFRGRPQRQRDARPPGARRS